METDQNFSIFTSMMQQSNMQLVNTMQQMTELQNKQIRLSEDLLRKQEELLKIEKDRKVVEDTNRQFEQFNGTPQANFMPGNYYETQGTGHMPAMGGYQNIRVANSFEASPLNPNFAGSRMTAENMAQLSLDRGSSTANAIIGGGGALAGTMASYGGYGLANAALGPLGGLLVGGIAGAGIAKGVSSFVGLGQNEANVQQAYTKYLDRESYRFINASESTNDRGYQGFSLSQSQEAANFMRTINKKYYMEDTEMMNLLQGYNDAGLLKDVSDLETFKQKIEGLTKNVKTGAIMLNETYESITQLMGEMKKMGISPERTTEIMSAGKLLGGRLGMEAGELIRGQMDLTGNYISGTGLSGEHYAVRTSDNLAFLGRLYDRFENQGVANSREASAYNFIKNNGGVIGTGQTIMAMQDQLLKDQNIISSLFFDYDSGSDSWVMNRQRFNNVMNGDYTYGDLAGMAERHLNSYDQLTIKNWQDNYQLFVPNALGTEDIMRFSDSISRAYTREMGGDPRYSNQAGMQAMLKPFSAEQRAIFEQFMGTTLTESADVRQEQILMAKMQELNASLIGQTPTIGEKFKYGVEGIKERLGGWGAALTDSVSTAYSKFNERLYGKRHTEIGMGTMFDWSSDFVTPHDVYADKLGRISGSLSGLENSFGTSIDPRLKGNLTRGAYSGLEDIITKQRSVLTNVGGLSDYIKIDYDNIKDISKKENLSEAILAALVQFSSTGEAKTLFGADQTTIAKIAQENSLGIADPTRASRDQQMAMVAEYINKTSSLYGGNQELAMRAFLGGQGALDQELRNLGHSIDEWRRSGNDSGFNSIRINDLRTGGAGVSSVGSYNPTGSLVGAGAYQRDNINRSWERGAKKRLGSDDYYDLIHHVAEQTGISANLLGTTVAIESSGRADLIGSSYDMGLTQILPKYKYKPWIGKQVTLSDGSLYTIGEGLDPNISDHELNNSPITRKDLLNPEVNLILGAHYMRDLNERAGGNTALAYAGYNVGGTAFDVVEQWAGPMYGKNAADLTADEISNIISTKHPSANARKKGANIKRFAEAYDDGAINIESMTIKDNTDAMKILEDIKGSTTSVYEHYDAATGDIVSESVLRERSGRSTVKQRKNDMQRHAATTLSGRNWRNVLDAAGDRRLGRYGELDPDDRNTIIKNAAQLGGISIDPSQLNTRMGRVNAEVAIAGWYRNTQESMNGFINGTAAGNSWEKKNLAQKAETIQMMDIISRSGIGEDFGLTLVPESGLYTSEELELINDISAKSGMGGKKGVFESIGDVLGNDMRKADKVLQWSLKGGQVSGSGSRGAYNNLLAYTPDQAKTVVEKELLRFEKSDKQMEKQFKVQLDKMVNKENDPSVNAMRKIFGTGDYSKLITELERGETAGLDRRIKYAGRVASGGVKLSGMSMEESMEYGANAAKAIEALKGLLKDFDTRGEDIEKARKELEEMDNVIKETVDVSQMTDIVSGLLYGDDEGAREGFLKEMNMKIISSEEKLSKMVLGDILDIQEESRLRLIETVQQEVYNDFDKFQESIGETLTDELLKELESLDIDPTGEMTKETADTIGSVFLNLINELGVQGDDFDRDLSKTLDGFEDSTTRLLNAVSETGDNVEIMSGKLERQNERVSRKLNDNKSGGLGLFGNMWNALSGVQ